MSSGWGEFTIYVDIAYKDGRHQQLSHGLKLPPSSEKAVTRAREKMIVGSEEESEERIASSEQQTETYIKNDAEAWLDQPNVETEKRPHNPTVFISGGIADAPAVHSLRQALEKLNARTVGVDDLPAGVPIQSSVSNLIAEADLAVFLVSGRPSLWMEQEIEAAVLDNTQLLPILLGSESEPPDTLKEFKSLRLDNQKEVASLAQTILKDWT